MKLHGRWWIVIGITGSSLVLLWLLFSGTFRVAANQTAVSTAGWTTVFTDTFEIPSSSWVITDTTGGAYRWNDVPYVFDMGSTILIDHGFWAAGGGTLGEAQTWPTGTYTNAMTTWAIAGPFTPTQKTWDIQVQFMFQNRVASGDTLFAGLSDDGVNFTGVTLGEASTEWEQLRWSTQAYSTSTAVWVGLAFTSDSQDVATGPLVDNLSLSFNYGTNTYLPLVRRDPLPTPTPMVEYFDTFNNPASGWHTGEALRYNSWCRWGDVECYERWEVVAEMSYYNSNYRFEIPLTWHGGGDVDTWFVWPAEVAPLPESFYPLPDRYCIEARGKFANAELLDPDWQPYWAHWGIVFAANTTMTELFSFQVNVNQDYAVLHHHNYVYPGNRQPFSGEEVNVEIPILGWGNAIPHAIYAQNYNKLTAVIDGHTLTLYANGDYLRQLDTGPIPNQRIGLIAGDWEVTPVDVQIDYFRYVPDCPELQSQTGGFAVSP